MTEQPPRLAMVIAVGFPPMGGSGVQRTTKFVKYLPEFGWNSAVLTADPESDLCNVLDPSLAGEVPVSTEVVRVRYRNPGERLLGMLFLRRARGGPAGGSTLATSTEAAAPGSVGLLRRTVRAAKKLVAAPVGDRYFYWSRCARRRALELARKSGARVVYVSASPYSSLLLGLWLKRRVGLPFAADFRDFWTTFLSGEHRGLRFRVNRHFERKVLRGADAVICNHELMREEFERIEPGCRGKCVVLTNGFDPADFEGLAPVQIRKEIAHVGVAWQDSPVPVLRALAAMRASGAVPSGFRVRFVGGLPPSSLALVSELGLEGTVSVESRVDHARAIEIMRSAAALLLLPGARRLAPAIPGKLFEYLMAGRPVVCVSPTRLAADLVRESGCGVVFEPEETAEIQRAIAGLASDAQGWSARHYRPREDFIDRFDRRKLTGQLARLFDRLAAGEPVS